MSGNDNKKSKRRRMKKLLNVTKATISCPEVPLTRADLNGEALNIEKLMDAQDDESALKMLNFSRGSNPFIKERCLLCSCERPDPPEADDVKFDCSKIHLLDDAEDKQALENNPLAKLPLWVCPSCRQAADQDLEKKPTLEQFLDHESEPFLPDVSIKSGSEPTTPNGSICTCEACTERRYIAIESEHEQETADLQLCWMDLRKVVRCLYGNREDSNSEELNVNRIPADEHVIELVHKLCSRDPHQLFLRLESQVREFVIRTKLKLLKQLKQGIKTPPQAKKFITLLLDEYAHLGKVARKMTGLLKELQNHLKRFKVTWDLHNKHLFQSICFSEPSIKNSLNLLISQLRLGAESKEAFSEDLPYTSLLHLYLKFEDEMSVINVVWRDCHQLIESYNEEQSALKLKQKMLREDWEFFKTQRKLLEQQVSQNPKASLSHNLEAQFTETMRLMLQGNKPSQDELTCNRCNRKRCPCDECTITHMITCGIINPEVLDSTNAPNPLTSHHNANFMHDPNRYRIDVSPPSMSSTTSSSGSSSPIMVDTERLALSFPDNDNRNDEIQEVIDNQSTDNDEDDDNEDDNDDDEEEDDDGDADNEEETDTGDKEESVIINEHPLMGMVEIAGLPSVSLEDGVGRTDYNKVDSCNCDHCLSQAKFEQVMKPEDNPCQCHVCLRQQGKAVSTTLPQHISSIVPPPGELHLYPHIHGSLGRGHVRPILQPNLYNLHLSNQDHKSMIQQTKVPIQFDFKTPEDLNDHFYHSYGEWDNSTYDPRLQLGSGSGKFESELLPPPPFSSPYTASLLTEPLNLPGLLSSPSPGAASSAPNSSAFVSTFANHTSSNVTAQSASKITDNLSVLTTKETLGEQLANKHHQRPSNESAPPLNHNPPCSRPATLGGNNAPKVVEKGHSQHCKKHGTQGNINKTGTTSLHNHSNNQKLTQSKERQQFWQQCASSLKQPTNHTNHSCSHANNAPSKVASHLGTLRDAHSPMSAAGTCPNAVQLPTTVNNVSVGTSTVCTEPDCDGNYDNDSFDDNCSEKSSSTSNSTSQKEGKYCDCCYCEFFGHGNPPVAPTSKNFLEMREKLRLRLKKKQTETKPDEPQAASSTAAAFKCVNLRPQGSPTPIPLPPASVSPPCEDLLEKKGLDELIKYINGTEEDDKKPLSAKAAKRARQKQRKAEEKAKQEAERLREEQERERLQLEEEQRLADEAERKKNESLTKKQRKQAARRAKSSSNSPVPNTSDVNSVENDIEKIINKNKKKGKHKTDELPALQVNITCEFENGTEADAVKPANHKPVISNGTGVFAGPSPLKTVSASRPNPQGGHAVLTPPSIDNRIVINSRQNKNKESSKLHAGGNECPGSNVSISKDHISHMTPQDREFIQKKTQQFIQMKLQEEAKRNEAERQRQLHQHHQQHLVKQAQSVTLSEIQKSQKFNGKPVQKEKQPSNPDTPKKIAENDPIKSQALPVSRNNMKFAMKSANNMTQNKNSPRLIEQNNNNVPRQENGSCQSLDKKNGENKIHNSATAVQTIIRQTAQHEAISKQQQKQPLQKQSQQQPVQCQNHVLSQAFQPVTKHVNHAAQQNGLASSLLKSQPRQAPAGQSQDGKVTTPRNEKKPDQGKARPEDSPPSDQGKSSGGRTKKVKRRNKGGGDINFIDEVFMPKSESDIEGGEMDEYEREIEEFKRFCADSSTPAKREKLQVNVNIKDIFSKKKSGLTCN